MLPDCRLYPTNYRAATPDYKKVPPKVDCWFRSSEFPKRSTQSSRQGTRHVPPRPGTAEAGYPRQHLQQHTG